jgi:hypothetical protein
MQNPLATSTLTAVIQEARRTELLIHSTSDNDSISTPAQHASRTRLFPFDTGSMSAKAKSGTLADSPGVCACAVEGPKNPTLTEYRRLQVS